MTDSSDTSCGFPELPFDSLLDRGERLSRYWELSRKVDPRSHLPYASAQGVGTGRINDTEVPESPGLLSLAADIVEKVIYASILSCPIREGTGSWNVAPSAICQNVKPKRTYRVADFYKPMSFNVDDEIRSSIREWAERQNVNH